MLWQGGQSPSTLKLLRQRWESKYFKMALDPDNTYFIHSAEGYEIYVEGQSLGMAYELPEHFKNFRIYEKGEQLNE